MVVIDRYPAFARDGTMAWVTSAERAGSRALRGRNPVSDFRYHEPKEAHFRKVVAVQRHRARKPVMREVFPPKPEALSTSAA
jgi:hypothetical protein